MPPRYLARALVCLGLLGACGARSGLRPGERETSAGGATAGAGGAGNVGGQAGGNAAGTGQAGMGRGGSTGPVGGMSGGGGGSAGAAAGNGGVAGTSPCPTPISDEVCNGLDDDCDGEIDEDLPLEVIEGPIAARVDEGRTDEGSTVDCISCSWAWHPQLVAPDDQLGVVWYLGIYGGQEQPSSFYRRLSWELEPRDDVATLGPQYWMRILRRGQTGPLGTLLTFVERVEHQDFPSFGFVDGSFRASVSTALEGCASAAQQTTLSPLLPGLLGCARTGGVRLFQIDETEGTVLATENHDVGPSDAPFEVVGPGVAAQHDDQGLFAQAVRPGALDEPRALWTVAIASDGTALGEPLLQQLEMPMTLHLQGLFPTPGGYLLFGDEPTSGPWPGGRFVVPLALDGTLSGPVVRHDDGVLKDFDEVTVQKVGSGFVVAHSTETRLLIEQLDGSGVVLRELELPASVYSGTSLLYAHGHLYAAFTESPSFDGPPNRVLVARFSCKR